MAQKYIMQTGFIMFLLGLFRISLFKLCTFWVSEFCESTTSNKIMLAQYFEMIHCIGNRQSSTQPWTPLQGSLKTPPFKPTCCSEVTTPPGCEPPSSPCGPRADQQLRRAETQQWGTAKPPGPTSAVFREKMLLRKEERASCQNHNSTCTKPCPLLLKHQEVMKRRMLPCLMATITKDFTRAIILQSGHHNLLQSIPTWTN